MEFDVSISDLGSILAFGVIPLVATIHLTYFNSYPKGAPENFVTELSQNQVWFRDQYLKIFEVGTATSLVIAGWLISTDRYDLGRNFGSNEFGSALLLILITVVVWPFWVWVVMHVRSKCPDHETVISKNLLFRCCMCVVYCQLFFVILSVRN